MNPTNDTPSDATVNNPPQPVPGAGLTPLPQPVDFNNTSTQPASPAPMGNFVDPALGTQPPQPPQPAFAAPVQPNPVPQPGSFAQPPMPPGQTSFAAPMPAAAPMPTMQTPGLASAYYDASAPGLTLGILSIIGAIIFPLGFILGIVSVIKGFVSKPGNKILGILGLVGMITSVVVGYLAISFVLNEYKYNSFLTATGNFTPLGGTDTEYSFNYPKQFTEDPDNEEDFISYEHKSKDDESLVVSKVALSLSSALGNVSIDELEDIIIEEDFKETFASILEKDVNGKNLVITNIDTAYSHSVGNASLVEFTFDSGAEKAKGELMLVADEDTGVNYSMYLASVEEVWDLNADAWDEIKSSLNR